MIDVAQMRVAQRAWAARSVRERLRVVRAARELIAEDARLFAGEVGGRGVADTLAAEVLPLLEACRYLERESVGILRVRKLRGRRALWLRGVSGEVRREAHGVVLVIGPGNYPLFLPGVQALQGLVAGNAVIWKPGLGGEKVAQRFDVMMRRAGLPDGLLVVTDESRAAAERAIDVGVDKVFLTGSAATGRVVMRKLAETLTPSVMELSGCDAVFVLESADVERVVDALLFGLRLNGSATCMAPRRVFGGAAVMEALTQRLLVRAKELPAVALSAETGALVEEIVADAHKHEGVFVREAGATVILRGRTEMRAMSADVFAPLVTLCEVEGEAAALEAYAKCKYALTAAVFGEERAALAMAAKIEAGTVLVNDVIVPTADARAPFGGRGKSGFGVTRGREGLLEMTAVKTVLIRRGKDARHYAPTAAEHAAMFGGYAIAAHGRGPGVRLRGMWHTIKVAMKIGK